MPFRSHAVSIFFFQAEDGIRDYKVTEVQTCALPICGRDAAGKRSVATAACAAMGLGVVGIRAAALPLDPRELDLLNRLCEREAALSTAAVLLRSEERRVGKEGRARRWSRECKIKTAQ